MKINVLTQKEAYSHGDELWVVHPDDKATISRLDWLLNFQISRAHRHQAKKLPPQLNALMQKCALKDFDFTDGSHQESPLLIAASSFVPVLWVLLSRGLELKKWCQHILEVRKKINLHRVRVFLPQEISLTEFESTWSHVSDSSPINVVVH